MNEYHALYSKLIASYEKSELEQFCKTLNRLYNIYDSDELRWNQIIHAFAKTPPSIFVALKEVCSSNQLLNDLIFQFYPCERVVKYYLIRMLKELKNNIVAFEMSVGQSRIDIFRINGESFAYEIKTEYDSFDRLCTQMNDYIRAFEKVYLVIPHSLKEFAAEFVPETCGILTYSWAKDGTPKFYYAKKAQRNKCDFTMCAESLSSADLDDLLRLFGNDDTPIHKDERLNLALEYAERLNPWPAYKMLLKNKFFDRWQFITSNFQDIVPIDVQAFFSTTSNPRLTYMR